MKNPRKPIIAVVTAIASGFAEKELLGGIISENKKNGYSTVVFSNIYNIVQVDDDLLCERKIYDFVLSQDVSGIILLCESFIVERSREHIASVLGKAKVPIVGIGTRLAEFETLDYTLLSTDDAADVEELTSHLIEEHGFTDIAILTGMEQIESSHRRVDGYLRALEKHGIEPDESKIYYGDFWFTSGEQLAERYISGELRLPQAIVCANDVMAYGIMRRFFDAGIRISEQVSVVSYDFSDKRIYHSPALTSFRKGRTELGASAAEHLQSLIEGRVPPQYIPPRGRFVFGNSCPCKADEAQSVSELRSAERRQDFNELSLFSSMEHKLTLCRDMEGFMAIIKEYQWMIQYKQNIYFCLYSDWNEAVSDCSGVMNAVSIFDGSAPFEKDHANLHTFFERNSDAAVCYLNPLFSGQKLFGYMALLYSTPSSYEDVYRHWLKSFSIGLEFLRLKNDIRYLISCQNVSENRDTLTGMNNKRGLRRVFQTIRVHGSRQLYFVALRIDLFPSMVSDEGIRRKTEAVLGVSKAIAKFCGNHDVAGRTDEDMFVCIVQSLAEPDFISDLLTAVLLQEKSYTNYAGTSSFACVAIPCDGSDFDELLKRSTELIKAEHNKLAALRGNRNFPELISVRDRIYSSTEVTFEPDSENAYTDRLDYFRRSYKSCFGLSFHQDCINARIARAKYYLLTTTLGINDISEKCGYLDFKYFHRQFTLSTGMTPRKYRNLIKG